MMSTQLVGLRGGTAGIAGGVGVTVARSRVGKAVGRGVFEALEPAVPVAEATPAVATAPAPARITT